MGHGVALRLLATSDLHLRLSSRDPLSGRRVAGKPGLARLAHLIQAQRAQAPNSLLFDNGDFLQGSLDELFAEALDRGHAHPMIRAMNAMGYDAATLGNHEFNHGLDHLMKALGQAQFPVVSANLFRPAADGALVPLVQTSVILQRQLRTGLGQIAALRIGVTGAAPPQTAQWDRQVLAGGLHSGDIPHAIAPQVAALRRAGADLVVVLCHSGLGAVTAAPEAEHAARTVAAIPGVDAVIAGHSHDAYPKQPGPPDPSHAPIVMPGHEGSHLGLIDLHLLPRPGGGWAVRPVHTEALATSTARPRGSDARISALVRRDQAAARAQLGQTVGQIGLRLHSHFAPLVPDPTARLLAEACALHARSALAGRPEADWPVLGAAPAFGAHPGGPVLDLPPGNIRLADLQRICPFPNTVVAFRITGAGLRDWLEHAAGVFCTARPGTHNQPLLHPEQPLYTFDLIEGLEYEIDLTRARGSRITRLHHAGAIVAAHDRFILATNNYRASGGGGFAQIADADLLCAQATPVRRILATHLGTLQIWQPRGPGPWRFAPLPDTSVSIEAETRAIALVKAGQAPPGVRVGKRAGPGRVWLHLHL